MKRATAGLIVDAWKQIRQDGFAQGFDTQRITAAAGFVGDVCPDRIVHGQCSQIWGFLSL